MIPVSSSLRLQPVSNTIAYGGKVDVDAAYISPTLLLSPPVDSAVMQDEIFGPILPIFPISSIDDAIKCIFSFFQIHIKLLYSCE